MQQAWTSNHHALESCVEFCSCSVKVGVGSFSFCCLDLLFGNSPTLVTLFADMRFRLIVSGGHGGIALVFRAYRRVEKAVVVDLYEPQSFENLRGAWLPDESPSVVKFCAGDISEAGWLSSLLAREEVDASEVMVVACHACSMLSDELIRECVQCKVEFAIMPCCQGEDSRKGKMMLNAARNLNMPMGQLIDIARLGVIEASPGYKATLKRIDENITPQNRILIGLRETTKDVVRRYADRERFLQRMAKKYRHVAWRPKDQFIASSNPG